MKLVFDAYKPELEEVKQLIKNRDGKCLQTCGPLGTLKWGLVTIGWRRINLIAKYV